MVVLEVGREMADKVMFGEDEGVSRSSGGGEHEGCGSGVEGGAWVFFVGVGDGGWGLV